MRTNSNFVNNIDGQLEKINEQDILAQCYHLFTKITFKDFPLLGRLKPLRR